MFSDETILVWTSPELGFIKQSIFFILKACTHSQTCTSANFHTYMFIYELSKCEDHQATFSHKFFFAVIQKQGDSEAKLYKYS